MTARPDRSGTPDPGTVRAWADAFGMPDAYAAVDIETSGLDVDRDYVLQVGWCRVRDRAPVENAGVVVDHGLTGLEADLFRTRLARTKEAMADRGTDYQWTPETLRATGRPPREAAAAFAAATGPGLHLVAHYGLAFDYPMLDRFCRQQSGVGLPDLSTGLLLDTAVLYKAAAAGVRPRPHESYASAVARVQAVRGPIKFSMARCTEVLGLAKYGASGRRTHDAAYDAWMAVLVFESLRSLAQSSVQ